MIHELKEIGETFNTEYSLYRPDILVMVVVMNNLLAQDAESRKVYSEGTLPDLFFGSALVVSNPFSRAIRSFFISLSKPAVPLALVNSIESSIAWLESVRT